MDFPPNSLMTEATIQGEFYHACRSLKLNCILEYKTPVGRHDCVILNHNWTRLVAIVEVKNEPGLRVDRHVKQVARYRRLGIPVHLLCRFSQARPLAESIKAQIDRGELPGVLVEEARHVAGARGESAPRPMRSPVVEAALRMAGNL